MKEAIVAGAFVAYAIFWIAGSMLWGRLRKKQNQPSPHSRTINGFAFAGLIIVLILAGQVGDRLDFVSQRNTEIESVDPGHITAGSYLNDQLGIQLPVPSGWHIVTTIEKENLKRVGQEAVSSGMGKRSLPVVSSEPVNLLTVFKHAPNRTALFNPGLCLTARYVGHKNPVPSAMGWLTKTLDSISTSRLSATITVRPEEVKLRGHDWAHAALRYDMTQPAKQEIYACRVKKYMVWITFTSVNENEQKELEDLFNRATFKF